jgi:hypothetical protein
MVRATLVMLSAIVLFQAAASRDAAVQAPARPVDFGPDDPVAKDRQHYSVEIENEHVRVVRVKYAAREPGLLHEHRCGRVTVYLTPTHQSLKRPNGDVTESRAKAGEARWSTPDRHQDLNLDDTPIELVFVDVKSACGK